KYASPQGPSALVSLSGFDSEGQDHTFEHPQVGPVTAHGLDWDRAAKVFGQAAWKGLTLTAAWSGRGKGQPTGAYGSLVDDPRNANHDARGFIELRYERSFATATDLYGRAYYDSYRFEGYYAYPDEEAQDSKATLLNRDVAVGHWIGLELRGVQTLFSKHRLVAGLELKRHLRQEQENFDEGGEVYLDDHRASTVFGTYLQGEVDLWGWAAINAGLRYDHYDSFGGTLHPRLAIIVTPFSSTTLKLLYGRAFRPPNVEELFYRDGYSYKVAPSGSLGPEHVSTHEVVLEQGLGRSVRLTVLGYHLVVRDLISLVEDPADSLLYFTNQGSVDAFGGEAQVDVKGPWGTVGRASYALQQATAVETGERLTNSPTHMAKLHLSAPLYWRWLRAGAQLLYLDRRRTLSGAQVDPYLVSNLTVTAEGLGGVADVSASVYNLFDVRYGDPGSREHFQDELLRDGRSFRLKLLLHF
ncbi:MAG: TonB-dependent receptor, partial [Deltaproteobacteria bacterium]|nr:TonB-dependent receptor [Deltaproteobacteria bacterium]